MEIQEYIGIIWVKREFAASAEQIALHTVGVVRTSIQVKDHPVMVTIRYYYTNPHLRIVIANEIDRQITVLL